MSYTIANGRFANQVIRNLAVSFIAERHNLKVDYINGDVIRNMGIDLFCGEKEWENTLILNDDNYKSFLTCDRMTFNVGANDSYFQTEFISKILYKHLNSIRVKNKICSKNPFQNRYNNNNDIGIHIRLGDIAYNDGKDVSVDYYIKIIDSLLQDSTTANIFIATDSFGHPTILKLREIYPRIIFINDNEWRTIQFISTCKYIVLSHGSFSALIGWLAYFSKVFYPNHLDDDKLWYSKALFDFPSMIKVIF